MITRPRSIVSAIACGALLAYLAGCEPNSTVRAADGQATTRPTADQLAAYRARLTPGQYAVMFEANTEPPFQNAYHDNHAAGTYVSAATGVPLFASDDKYDSGTGWPSFVKPIAANAVIVRKDADGDRDEVLDASSGAHLGHVFDDGPANRGGRRFCMNSAALKFIPAGQPLPATMPAR